MKQTLSAARLLLVNALIRAAAAASGQLFAFLLADRLGAKASTGAALVGALAAVFFAVELLGAPVAGRVADQAGQVTVLRKGPLFGAASAAVAAATTTVDLGVAPLAAILVVARAAEGLSGACSVPTTLTLLARATEGDARRRSSVTGLFEITSLIAMLVGYAIAGVGWDAWGPAAFLLLPGLYAIAWAGLRGVTSSDAAHASAKAATTSSLDVLRRWWRAPGAIAFGLAWLAVNAVVGVWLQQAPYLLKLPARSATQALVGGFDGRDIALIFAAWGAAFLVGIGVWSTLGANVPRRTTLTSSLVAMLVVLACLAIVNHGGSSILLGVALFAILVESGFTPAAVAHLADSTEGDMSTRGATMVLYSLLLGGGQLLGSVLGAPFAARWQMDGVLAVSAILALLALGAVRAMPSVAKRRSLV